MSLRSTCYGMPDPVQENDRKNLNQLTNVNNALSFGILLVPMPLRISGILEVVLLGLL